MPLYEYRCTGCGECVEVLQHVSDAPLTGCPRCGGAMEKLLSAPALQFRGSGWYVTDYARKGNGSSSTHQSGEAAATAEKTAEAPKAAAEPTKPAASTPASAPS